MADQLLQQDVLVLGAGPAGISAADHAIKQGLSVLMLEGGVRKIFPVDAWDVTDETYPIYAGGIGGQSSVWGAQIVFPEHNFLLKLAKRFGADDTWIEELLKELEEMCNILKLPISSSNKYYSDEIFCEPNFKTKYSIYLKKRNLVGYFHATLSQVDILKDTKIYSLQFESNGIVKVITSRGNWVVTPDKALIIALGSIETTLILKRSNLTGTKDIGKGLHDHPSGYILSFPGKHLRGIRRSPTRRFSDHELKRKFEYLPKTHSNSAIIEFHYDLRGNLGPGHNLSKANSLKSICFYFNAISLRLFGTLFFPVPQIHVWLQIEQEQTYINKIEDFSGKPRITWTLSQADKGLICEILKTVREYLDSLGIEPTYLLASDQEIQSQFRPVLHPAGTIPANMSPNYGITDSFGALHLYHNIGVASGAILPTTSWFNPTLLIMSMARLTCSRIINSTFNPTRGL